MSDLIVSIVESLAGAAATAAERRRGRDVATAPPPSRSQPQPLNVVVPAAGATIPEPGRVAAASAVARPPKPALPARRLDVRQLIDSPQSLLRSVIAGEILGAPLALRRQNLWDDPSV